MASSREIPEFLKNPYLPDQDKLAHTLVYFVLTALFLRGFHREKIPWTPMVLAICILLSSLYGMSDEWHQSFVPGRTTHWADWAADSLGALLVLLFKRPLKQLFDWEEQILTGLWDKSSDNHPRSG